MSAGIKQLALTTTVQILAPASQAAGAVLSSAIDTIDYEGQIAIQQHLGALTGTIGTITVQHSDTSGGSYTATDQEGQAFGTTANGITTVLLDKNKLKRFIKYSATVSTNPVLLAVSLIATKKNR